MLNLAVRAPLAVALGAIAGALGRYYVSRWLLYSVLGTPISASGFPLATFVVNVSGCLLMGFATTVGDRLGLPLDIKLLLLTGGLGAYTTFSTYSLEAVALLNRGRLGIAGLYWIGSAVVGLGALQMGILLGRLGCRS
ncbi:MAG: fluoride efflux transporter CrcB [Elainellaceae cyanobacterium]